MTEITKLAHRMSITVAINVNKAKRINRTKDNTLCFLKFIDIAIDEITSNPNTN